MVGPRHNARRGPPGRIHQIWFEDVQSLPFRIAPQSERGNTNPLPIFSSVQTDLHGSVRGWRVEQQQTPTRVARIRDKKRWRYRTAVNARLTSSLLLASRTKVCRWYVSPREYGQKRSDVRLRSPERFLLWATYLQENYYRQWSENDVTHRSRRKRSSWYLPSRPTPSLR